jgi:hypothetical protein
MDSLHLAVCAIEEINYLLTWNCTHLGFTSYEKLRSYNEGHGLWTPLLVTPDYLLGLVDEEEPL